MFVAQFLDVVVPAKARDPYAVSPAVKKAVRRLSRNNRFLWLWVPAIAGTTGEGRVRFTVSNFKQQQPQLRDLAARFARGLACSFRPLRKEGAGNAGRPMRPLPRVQG
jgi:hypothetical protein